MTTRPTTGTQIRGMLLSKHQELVNSVAPPDGNAHLVSVPILGLKFQLSLRSTETAHRAACASKL